MKGGCLEEKTLWGGLYGGGHDEVPYGGALWGGLYRVSLWRGPYRGPLWRVPKGEGGSMGGGPYGVSLWEGLYGGSLLAGLIMGCPCGGSLRRVHGGGVSYGGPYGPGSL